MENRLKQQEDTESLNMKRMTHDKKYVKKYAKPLPTLCLNNKKNQPQLMKHCDQIFFQMK